MAGVTCRGLNRYCFSFKDCTAMVCPGWQGVGAQACSVDLIGEGFLEWLATKEERCAANFLARHFPANFRSRQAQRLRSRVVCVEGEIFLLKQITRVLLCNLCLPRRR